MKAKKNSKRACIITDQAFNEESKDRTVDALQKAIASVKTNDLAWAKTWIQIAGDFAAAAFWTHDIK